MSLTVKDLDFRATIETEEWTETTVLLEVVYPEQTIFLE